MVLSCSLYNTRFINAFGRDCGRFMMEKRVIPFSPPDITEEEVKEVSEALRYGWITTGPRTKKLERRLAAFIETGKNDVDTESDKDKWSSRLVCLSSATATEELNFRICGIGGGGDEVIVPAYTYTATASAALHTGAKLVMVDSQKDSVEMDYDKLRDAITPRTKAIVAVDLGGIVADYDTIYKIAEEKKSLFTPSGNTEFGRRIQKAKGRVLVFADSAHSLGASRNGVMAGRIADFTSFSFHAVKNFTTAEGGAATWLPIDGVSDAEIYKQFQLYSLHGQSKDALSKTNLGAWEYDILGPWYKCNMTDILASLGLVQLDRYPSLLKRRREIIKAYDSAFKPLGIKTLNHFTDTSISSGHLYIVRIPGITVEQRNEIIAKMAEAGIATNVHYKPLPMFTAYKELGFDIKNYPNAYNFYHNAITLPLYTKLSDEDVEYIISKFASVVSEVRGSN